MPAKPPRPRAGSPVVYRFAIPLLGSDRPIWRRLQVPDTTLHAFHHILQIAMGWTNSHLYHLELDCRRFSDPDPGNDYGDPPEDARRTSLSDLGLREGSELTYLYDFGDAVSDWSSVAPLGCASREQRRRRGRGALARRQGGPARPPNG